MSIARSIILFSIFVLAVGTSGTARAQAGGVVVVGSAPTIEASLHQQLQVAAQSLYKQIDEVMHLSTIIATVKDLVRTSNEIAALGRFVKNAYDTARRYTSEDLSQDAHEALYRTFPELIELEDNLELAVKNGTALDAGPREFFSMRDYRDRRLQGLWLRTAERGLAASIYPKLFPNAYVKTGGKIEVTEAEKLVQAHFARAGMARRVATQNAVAGALGNRVTELVKDAEGKNRLDLALLSSTATAQHQLMVDTAFLRAAKEADLAEEQANRLKAAERERILREDLEPHVGELFSIGRIQ